MKKLVYLLLMLLAIVQLQAQNGVAISTDATATPDASAILDVQSTTQGMLVPRMTEAQKNAISPGASGTSLLIYQTDGTPGFYYFDGSTWTTLSGAKSINDLSDGKTGSSSLYLGGLAGSIASGSYNIGIGLGSLGTVSGNNNTALGYAAGGLIDAGGNNVCIGYYAGNSTSSGNSNVFLGYESGKSTTSGNYNILLGYQTEPSSSTASQELNIGYAIYGTGLYNTAAKIGIGNGNNAPTATLDVDGDVKVATSINIGTAIHLTPGSAPSSPTEGDMYMDATTHKLMVYDGTTWQACW